MYEIGRIFRNEGVSSRHNPEFTTVELYQAYSDYHDIMTLTEQLMSGIALDVVGKTKLTYQGHEIDLTPPWRRLTMHDAVKEKTGIDFTQIASVEDAKNAALSAGVPTAALDSLESVGEIVCATFEHACEASLIQPTFVIDYPKEVSPLAKPHRSKPGLVERFELYTAGREIANAFSELTDPVDQMERFQAQLSNKNPNQFAQLDEEFVHALEQGMPPAGGLGIGLDRFAMLLTDSASIREVIAFPTMRRLADDDHSH